MINCTYFKNGICVATSADCEGIGCDGYTEPNVDSEEEETPAE